MIFSTDFWMILWSVTSLYQSLIGPGFLLPVTTDLLFFADYTSIQLVLGYAICRLLLLLPSSRIMLGY